MRHTFYGDLPGRFEGKGSEFFKRGWWLWLLALSHRSFRLPGVHLCGIQSRGMAVVGFGHSAR